MRAGSALVDTEIAETPVAIIADVAAPVAFVRPGQTICTKNTTLESLLRIICSQCSPAFGTAGDRPWRDIATCMKHMRSFGICK